MKTRINPITGREEYWNEPKGLPGIWMERGWCQRCKPFHRCMGFATLSDDEWQSIENIIDEANHPPLSAELPELKKCPVY